MALALRVVGVADNVEFVATLLVAPVIAATLLVDRNLGYVVAGVAATAYLYLRFDDIQDAGAVGVVALVVFRAASYGGVAYVTPLLFSRLSGVSDVDIGVPARHLRAEAVDPAAPQLGSSDWRDHDDGWRSSDALAPAMAGGPEVDYGLDAGEQLADTYADAGFDPSRSWADDAPLDEWSAQAAALTARQADPPAPRVPTGWIDDATSPLGDETIPVGYTGELFLGRITGSVPVVPTNGARNGAGPGAGPGPGPGAGDRRSVGTNGAGSRPAYADTEPLRPVEPRRDRPTAPAFSGAGDADADAGLRRTEPLYGGPAADPDYDDGRAAARSTGPDEWSSRVGGGGSGERRSPWTTRSDDAWDTTPPRGGAWVDPHPSGSFPRPAPPAFAPSPPPSPPPPAPAAPDPSGGVDPETRLWNAPFFRDRLNTAIARSQATAAPFSVVMIQVADEPFQPLPYRRQVALLRELGHQFVPRFVDHLVHLPDGAQHWFAVVLDGTDRAAAQSFERRLRSTLAGYLRSRGLRVGDVQSASLTSPDDDEAMAAIWASLLGADNVGA